MPAGRPSKYKSAFCELAIEAGKEGCSIEEIAGRCEVDKQTIYNWIEEHKEFFDAIKKAKAFSELWWQEKGRKNLENPKFNYTGWYMNMRNRFGWADKQEHKHSGEVNINWHEERTYNDKSDK